MSVQVDKPVDGPVQFDPFSEDYFNGPWQTYRRLRDEAPVYYNAEWDFWALSRFDDVAAATKDHETFSSAKGATLDMVKAPEQSIPVPKVIISMDPPEHNRMRKLVSSVFTPRAVAALEDMVREKIYRLIERLDPAAGFDAVADFSAIFPNQVITTMLGVPEEDREQIRRWLDLLIERKPGQIHITDEGYEASVATGMYYYGLVQKRRAAPQDDMISRLIETEIERDGRIEKLTDVDITGFATMLGGAGAETVTKLIGNAVVAFADFPDEWQKLRADRSKIPAAIEELLRFEAPSQYQVRVNTRDVTLHGTTIPEGSAVLLLTGSALRDERVFRDPDRLDIDRDRVMGFNLAFGYGIHSCLGAALARMESRIALEALLDLIPEYEVDRAGLRRVQMSNVSGFKNVPVRAGR
ncbi:cytochrome P450 [Mycolicibacterium thermoresistibile]|uniref:Steroid C26-monooxygenase n=2 Tax=Mycolicibacterium thermoresistibile TaxID=1797 RepID=G7CN62_MYCT3|nr:cytochrome P450 [Mycolicibacterium thermoresistibile]EHI10551.1 cytochrome P450 [Mycolicibacterium thermoresistibile ATCC 19527]MCV7189689.1 cytochrome P450 [Mycolicibacterium thermoresistibile]GAT15397.1 cytochrome P450 [Mycolicibacterium thermoresistibile]SNW17456.1 cytochrome P450 [Mycolicibacterium thermoresistibile]